MQVLEPIMKCSGINKSHLSSGRDQTSSLSAFHFFCLWITVIFFFIMDLFADDIDDDVKDDINDTVTLCNIAFLELMICKPFVKSNATENPIVFHRNIVLIGEKSVTSLLKEKLDRTQFKNVKICCPSSIGQYEGEEFDIVVDLNFNAQLSDENIPGNVPGNVLGNALEKLLLSGGTYMTLCPSSKFGSSFQNAKWNTAKVTRKPFQSTDTDQCLEFIVVQKRGFLINTLGAIYWTGDSNDDSGTVKIGQKKDKVNKINTTQNTEKEINTKNMKSKLLDTEYSNLEEVTVALSLEERREGVFSDISHSKALSALQNHGLCILPGIFSTDMVMEWGDAAVSDMKEALFTLRKRGIDLLHPGEGGPRIENFHELSMREALRCDLRNGRHLKTLSQRNSINSTAATSLVGDYNRLKKNEKNEKNNDDNENKEMEIIRINDSVSSIKISESSTSKSNRNNIRQHPALLSILHRTLNPLPQDPRDQLGNWGLWNFEGRGPEFGPPGFAIGEVGAVMSLPGCADQTIHADTPHLYVHTQLPGHYINLFVPAVAVGSSSGVIEVGQTAFVVGSHQLRISAHIMNEEGGQEMLENRLVRPHLHAGDALLFDCRILHFGLANQYPRVAIKNENENKDKNKDQNKDQDKSENKEENNDENKDEMKDEIKDEKEIEIDENSGESRNSNSGESRNSNSNSNTNSNNSTEDEKEGEKEGASDCSDGWRPLLYVNYHQKFFQDPKNWNEKEKLFT